MPQNPRLLRASRGIERRIFLRALALGLTAPVAARLARTALAEPGVAPKRFFLMYMPHGVAPEHYNPRVSASDATDFALDQTNVSILGPLQPYKSYVNVYSGFQYLGAANTHSGIVNCLSGYDGIDQTAPRTSVEHVIAHGLGVKPLILGACSHQPFGMDSNGMLFWDGTPVDPQKNPAAAADQVFAATTTPTPAELTDAELRAQILSFTASEVDGLKSELSGLTREQTKLQTHLNAIQALQNAENASGQSSCSVRPTLPSVEQVRAASAGQVIDPSGGNDYFYQEKNFPLIFQAQLELVAQALICNAAQVVALMPMYATCDFDFSFMGQAGSHHNTLSHMGPGGRGAYNSPVSIDNFDPNSRIPFAKAQLWFTEQLVNNVVKKLAETDDPAAPGSKVLDNTLIYWMSEIGDGQNHTRLSEIEYPQVPTYLPLVTIGKCAGAIKSGQVVQFPLAAPETAASINRPASDLYLTMARAMGVGTATFPGATGPVTEVLA